MLFLLKFKRFKVEDSIIICGDLRSGTTWLLDIVSKMPNTFTHWEPLHHEFGLIPQKQQWGDAPCIPKNETNNSYYKFIEEILSLKIYNKDSILYKEQSVISLYKGKIVITKLVRANSLLPYITHNFNLRNRPILIIRHPIDVCFSAIKAFQVIYDLESLNPQRFLKEMAYLQSLRTKLEYRIALWCINNCPLLEDKETLSKLTIVFYSDLVLNPEKETRRIFNNLTCVKKSDIDKIISSINFQQASGTDFKKDYIPNPEKQLQKNIKKLTQEEKERIQSIFDHFNFKLYDAYSVFPKKEYL